MLESGELSDACRHGYGGENRLSGAGYGVKRIVFTGGDPLIRPDIRLLILDAYYLGLEVPVMTTGDRPDQDFLGSVGDWLDNVSLPLDASCEAANRSTRGQGHFAVVWEALAILRNQPDIGITIGTTVTRHDVEDVPRILLLVKTCAEGTDERVSFVSQAFPRAKFLAPWRESPVSGVDFAVLRRRIWPDPAVATKLLDHRALDRPRVTSLSDGRVVMPRRRLHLRPVYRDRRSRRMLGKPGKSAERDDANSTTG
ncbi:MAG: radical SAM protein [Gemmatimonadales bacterium]